MKRCFGVLVLMLGVSTAGPGEKWGHIDKTGKFVIEPTFEYCSNFSEGLAAMKRGGKYGFIDKTGKVVIEPVFDTAYEFSEGLAAVRVNGKYGFVDKTGKIVIAAQFWQVQAFAEGRARFDVVVKEAVVTGVRVKIEQYGFVDRTGKIVIPAKFSSAAIRFADGLCAVGEDKKHGFIDTNGKWAIEPIYARTWNFSEGLAAVETKLLSWGYVDREGKMVIEPQYRAVGSFSGGRALVGRTSYTASLVIDRTGKVILGQGMNWKLAGQSEGMIRVLRRDRYGFLDEKGTALPRSYTSAYPFSEGLARVSTGFMGPYGYIDKAGKLVIPIQFPRAQKFSEGLAAVGKSN